MPHPFEIEQRDGVWYGNDGERTVALLDRDGRMFRRRAIRWTGGRNERIEWLVCELGGVRVYVSDTGVVVTRTDMLP